MLPPTMRTECGVWAPSWPCHPGRPYLQCLHCLPRVSVGSSTQRALVRCHLQARKPGAKTRERYAGGGSKQLQASRIAADMMKSCAQHAEERRQCRKNKTIYDQSRH